MNSIYINGKISSLDNNNNFYEALAVKDGLIAALGRNREILKLKNENTKIIDLNGKLMLPAFNDSHMHVVEYGENLIHADLKGAKSIEDIINTLKDFKEKNNVAAGEWIIGYGWNQDYFDVHRFPTREDLDKVSTENPIYITRACIHVACVNTIVLKLAGINKNTKQVDGGVFEVDNYGQPNGVLREEAMSFVTSILPQKTKEDIKKSILSVSKKLLKSGIASVQSDDFGNVKLYEDIINVYKELDEEGLLNIRVNQQCNMELSQLKDFILKGYNLDKGSSHFKLGPLKIISDGSLGARTAYMRNFYEDDKTTKGISIYNKEILQELISTAHDNNMSVAVHAIGDGAIEMAMNCIEVAIKNNPKKDTRHGIVHCQITDEMLLNRFKKLDLIAYIQPIFIHYDQHILEDRVGKELAKTSYNWKTLIDLGVVVCGSSDCPVESFDLMNNLYCAVTRKDLNGYPEEGYNKSQCLSIEEALKCFTIGGAYASFEENLKGTLEVGKFADMVVLDEDIYRCDKNKIKDININMTIVGGDIKYSL